MKTSSNEKESNVPNILLAICVVIVIAFVFSYARNWTDKPNESSSICEKSKDFAEGTGKMSELKDFEFPASTELIQNKVAFFRLANIVESSEIMVQNGPRIANDLRELGEKLIEASRSLETMNRKSDWLLWVIEKELSSLVRTTPGDLKERLRFLNTLEFQNHLNATMEVLDAVEYTRDMTESDLIDAEKEGKNTISENRLGNLEYYSSGGFDMQQARMELKQVREMIEVMENMAYNLGHLQLLLESYRVRLSHLEILLDYYEVRLDDVENLISNNTFEYLSKSVRDAKIGHQKLLAADGKLGSTKSEAVSQNLPSFEDDLEKFDLVEKSNAFGKEGCSEFQVFFRESPMSSMNKKTGKTTRLEKIAIEFDIYIHSLAFGWSDNSWFKYGGNRATHLQQILLNEGEDISSINVAIAPLNLIVGLEIKTTHDHTTGLIRHYDSDLSPNVYTEKTLEAPKGHKIVGIYGGVDNFICSLGVLYVKI